MATYEVFYSFGLEWYFNNWRMIFFLSVLILMFNLILYSRWKIKKPSGGYHILKNINIYIYIRKFYFI